MGAPCGRGSRPGMRKVWQIDLAATARGMHGWLRRPWLEDNDDGEDGAGVSKQPLRKAAKVAQMGGVEGGKMPVPQGQLGEASPAQQKRARKGRPPPPRPKDENPRPPRPPADTLAASRAMLPAPLPPAPSAGHGGGGGSPGKRSEWSRQRATRRAEVDDSAQRGCTNGAQRCNACKEGSCQGFVCTGFHQGSVSPGWQDQS